jgi:hypothetical protein
MATPSYAGCDGVLEIKVERFMLLLQRQNVYCCYCWML